VAAKPLIKEFKGAQEGETLLRWAIGNALSVVAGEGDFDAIAELIQDRRYGTARQMLADALVGTRDPRSVNILIGLLKDPDVVGHAIIALGKLRATKARPRIEPFLDHPMPWIRHEAKRAIEKINRPARRKKRA